MHGTNEHSLASFQFIQELRFGCELKFYDIHDSATSKGQEVV